MRICAIAAILLPAFALAEQCDCQIIVGRCDGAIAFISSYGSKPSYGAEIVVHSSERTCSKVEYYLDNTPHQTVLVNTNKVPESLFGTSPITEKSVTFRSCSICARVDGASSSKRNSAGSESKQPDEFSGTWIGSGSNSLGFSRHHTVTITPTGENQYQVAAELRSALTSNRDGGTATAQGKTLSYSIRGGAVNCSLTLQSATSMRYECSGSGGSSDAVLTKQ